MGISVGDLKKLEEAKVTTFGQYAFICPFTPNSSDESALVTAPTDILADAPGPAAMIPFRRLYYESHAIATSEMKSRLKGP